jgi:hypothetical protein
MRRILMTALVGAAIAAVPAAPAQAGLTLVGTFSGNQCTGGPITTCYAAGFTAMSGTLTQVGPHGTPVPGSPGILGLDGTGTITDFTDSLSGEILSFDYTGSEVAHFIGIFNGGSGLNCTDCKNTYQLFYDPDGITSGTIDLSLYFHNDGISHVDLFDSGAVPEPATWGLMLLGFAGVGVAMRRSRKSKPALMQIA